ncbi:MAG: hypothetical protein H7343_09360 [Undibacterium sp.]|nr:hypothetical protein [Opitutaceae bacterium]
MSAKEIVRELIRQLPDDASIDVIAQEVTRAAAAPDEFPHSSAGLPVFAVPSTARVIPGTRTNQILCEELT